MSVKLTPEEFFLVRDFIEELSGIRVGEGKSYLIESRLAGLLREMKCETFSDFYFRAKNGRQQGVRERIIDAMSTQETLWFRDMHPYRILGEVLLPQFAVEIKEGARSNMRIWSAASSTGQEPYSLAMTLLDAIRKQPVFKPEMFEIQATDIAPSALKVAQDARYDRIAMGRGLPPQYRQRYFQDEGRYARLSDEVRRFVSFKQFNLKESFASLGSFDVVLCRNVAIYFSDELKCELYAKIKRVLRSPGYLFLGSSESISAYSSDFELIDHDGAIFYKVKGR